jgi:signal transduction histidine kinase
MGPEVRTATATVRVLVVDDVADIRKLIRMTLERGEVFDVVGEAGDGAEAIAEAARLQPDVVVLDLSMPVMDGLEALPEIIAASPKSKVLVLSGFTATEMSEEALRLGAAAYMEKGGIVAKLGPRLRELVHVRAAISETPSGNGKAAHRTRAASTSSLAELFPRLIRDLSRPLAVLHALASRLLRADELPADTVRSALEAIAREARTLETILQTYSDTGKLEVGGLDLSLAPTNLPQLVRELIAEITDITAVHPVTVDIDDRVVVNVDPLRIRHVLMALLSNAAKFSPNHTPIEVTADVGDDTLELRVRDHGDGIAEAKRSELFKKGDGLALYISREIARAHGGDVFLASCDDTGSVFALRLRVTPS